MRDLLRARVQLLAARRARAEDRRHRFEPLFQFSRLRGFQFVFFALFASGFRLGPLSLFGGRVLVPRGFIVRS